MPAPFTGRPAKRVVGPPFRAVWADAAGGEAGSPAFSLFGFSHLPLRGTWSLKRNREKPRERGSNPSLSPAHPPSTAGLNRLDRKSVV